MVGILMQSTVKDYAEWRKVFDANEALRTSSGELSHQIYRDSTDGNKLIIFNQWDSLENAQKFANSPELRAAMAEAGVEGRPTVTFLNET